MNLFPIGLAWAFTQVTAAQCAGAPAFEASAVMYTHRLSNSFVAFSQMDAYALHEVKTAECQWYVLVDPRNGFMIGIFRMRRH